MPVPSLQNIPYDLLLSIAQHLDLADIYALQLCKHLRYAIRTRPVYRELVASLLRRCRALPLCGFNHISDLSTDQLVEVVNHAARLERGWLTRTPRPALNAFVPKGEEPVDGIATGGIKSKYWYKVARTPPDEEVDYLSPITAGYTICATKSGKVVCWDVHRDVGIAEWSHEERWELCKSRVEFERRTIYFTMTKALRGRDDDKVTQFELGKIHFPEQTSDSDEQLNPSFSTLRSFKTLGVVMNVFLLEPETRLLAGLMWISRFNSIGLYVLLDWNKEEYVFVDTAIQWTDSSKWACILCDGSIVIHSEEATLACQHFFPLSVLSQHVTVSNPSPSFVPRMTTRLEPTRSICRDFIFSVLPPESYASPFRQPIFHNTLILGTDNQIPPIIVPQEEDSTLPTHVNNPPHPWSYQLWYPEYVDFVRQWWPTLPSIPRLRSSAVLFSQRHPHTNVTKYVLAQHYFTVPLSASNAETDASDATMRMWYVSVPFEVVCVPEQVMDDDLPAEAPPRQRPLFAVDFGHAVWLEHVRAADEEEEEDLYERGQMRLRFVSFPGVRLEGEGHAVQSGIGGGGGPDGTFEMEGTVRTLAIPEELDLHEVDAINLDQSQGVVTLSVRQGKMFILCYE
ncbi:hypothetical protein F5148DRAFT_980552 [Russula earlei]|uniref:Uncharacterized protein n=1 Tax=Russula earlei TaxID=71964 RepID=A0ACC0UA00_9AGAM|nr:hypothetical protein F5148DRAFT_980552 [Russula earlei]